MEKIHDYFAKFKCEFCKKLATHYVTYKEFHTYLCNSKDCDLKFKVKTGIFDGLNVEEQQ